LKLAEALLHQDAWVLAQPEMRSKDYPPAAVAKPSVESTPTMPIGAQWVMLA